MMWSGSSVFAAMGSGSNDAAVATRSVPDVGQLVGHRPDRQHLVQPRALLQQRQRPLGEHRVHDQGGDPGVVDDVRVVVGRAERVQRRTPVALGLPGPEDEQHLRPVQREQRGVRPGTGAELLERLDVLADPVGRLAAGQGGVAQEHDGLVPVPLQRGHHQVTVVGAGPHRLVAHREHLRDPSHLVRRPQASAAAWSRRPPPSASRRLVTSSGVPMIVTSSISSSGMSAAASSFLPAR